MTLIKKTHGLTVERARQTLTYDPVAGDLRRSSGVYAGHITKAGYLRVTVDGARHMAHRLAWLLHYEEWPESDIDHVDGNKLNNRIENLRQANRSQNVMNSKVRSDNPTGMKGVRERKDRSTFAAIIKINGKQKTLGYFKSKFEAHDAYMRAARIHFREFARAN